MHATGCLALLEKARLVDHQHGVRIGQGLDRVLTDDVAQSIRLPVTAPEHRLLTPGPRITGCLGSHPAGLAPLRPQQTIQEPAGRGRHARRGKQRPDPLLGLTQARRPELQHLIKRGSRHRDLLSLP